MTGMPESHTLARQASWAHQWAPDNLVFTDENLLGSAQMDYMSPPPTDSEYLAFLESWGWRSGICLIWSLYVLLNTMFRHKTDAHEWYHFLFRKYSIATLMGFLLITIGNNSETGWTPGSGLNMSISGFTLGKPWLLLPYASDTWVNQGPELTADHHLPVSCISL